MSRRAWLAAAVVVLWAGAVVGLLVLTDAHPLVVGDPDGTIWNYAIFLPAGLVLTLIAVVIIGYVMRE